MKTAICDTPSSRASGIVNEPITANQRRILVELSTAIWLAGKEMRDEIEAVEIQAGHIDHKGTMRSIKVRLAFNPFLSGYSSHLSPKIINASGLWDIDRKLFWYAQEEPAGSRNFPTEATNELKLSWGSYEEVAGFLLEGLAKIIDKIRYSLLNEASHLEGVATRVRRSSMRAIEIADDCREQLAVQIKEAGTE
jgi:hypothetical protein